MRLTVVMSVLNGERYVSEAVTSILRQTFTDFRFIIVDDGSTDGTKPILERFAAADPRIIVLDNPGPGNYAQARMLGMEHSETEWVALMDADDVSNPFRLERQMSLIEDSGGRLGALGTWGRYIDERGQVVGSIQAGPTTLAEFERRMRTDAPLELLDPSSVIHRPSYCAVGGYRQDATPAADHDLWYRIAESGRAVLALPAPLLDYRIHTSSVSVSKGLLQRRKTHYINYNMRRRRQGLVEIGWNRFETEVWAKLAYRYPRLRRDLGSVWFKRAAMNFVVGHYVRAAGSFLLALPLHPGLVVRRVAKQLRWRGSRLLQKPQEKPQERTKPGPTPR